MAESSAVQIVFSDELERARLTVALRLFILIPLWIWLFLWGIAVTFAIVANWVATLILARSPQQLHDFIASYVRYSIRVSAYGALLADPFPGFLNDPGYAVETTIAPPEIQNRGTVFLRILLAIPALILNLMLSIVLQAVAVVGWFASLIDGRMPGGLQRTGEFCVRFNGQTAAYTYLLTPKYPGGRGPGESIRSVAARLPGPPDARSARLKARIVVSLMALVVGVVLLAWLGGLGIASLGTWLVFVLIYVPPWEDVPVVGRYIRAGLILLIAIVYPFVWNHMFTIPIFGAWPGLSTGVYMLVFMMMAVGLNIVVGYAGLLDLGYVAFYAMGAYTVAWFASFQFAPHKFHLGAVGIGANVPGFHISIWLLLIAAGFFTALIGILIGLPTLRLRGDYLAIVTLGFGEILPQIARNGDNLGGHNITNGPNGIVPIDGPGFGHLPVIGTVSYRAGYNTLFTSDRLFYWTAILLLLITIFCSVRLRDSRLGRAWVAIREDETAAAAMGVPLMRTKTWAYATGACFGGIAGGYYASQKSATFPGDFYFNISVFILCMVILGGMGNVTGVLVGAAFLAYLDREGLANTGGWLNDHLGVSFSVPKYEFGIFGVILVVVMLFRPEGLIPSTRRKAELHEGVHDEPLYDIQHGHSIDETIHGYDERTDR